MRADLHSACSGDPAPWWHDAGVHEVIDELGVVQAAEIFVELVQLQTVATEHVGVLAKFSEHVRRRGDHDVRERASAHDPIDRRDDVAREFVIARVRELLPVIVGRLLMPSGVAAPFAGLALLEHRAEVAPPRIHEALELGELVAGRVAFVVLADASSGGVDDRDASSHDRPSVQAMRPLVQKLAESTGNIIVCGVTVVAGVVNVFS